jgi:ABC-2 type transport system permease protein
MPGTRGSHRSPLAGARIALAVARNEGRVVVSDATALAILLVSPVVLALAMLPLARLALRDQGYLQANGSEHAVPAVAVTFSFYLIGLIGVSFFNEHLWGTWAKALALSRSPAAIISGKLGFFLGFSLAQQLVLFTLGALAMGLKSASPWWLLVPVAAAFAACVVAVGFALTAWVRTSRQLSVFANVATVLLSAMAGVLAPTAVAPAWMRALAPLSPCYWALSSYRQQLLHHTTLGHLTRQLVTLLGIALAAGSLGALRFRVDEMKICNG